MIFINDMIFMNNMKDNIMIMKFYGVIFLVVILLIFNGDLDVVFYEKFINCFIG